MKAITIKEPWASLIINGYKEYEFRSWKTNYRGKILIHAGKTLEKEYAKKFEEYHLSYGCGEIIGEAVIDDCVLVDEKLNKELNNKNKLVYGNNNHDKTYGFHVTNIKKYYKPIKCNGKLGLWNYCK